MNMNMIQMLKVLELEAAEKLNLDVREVFKTLMVSDDKNFFCCSIAS